MKASIAMPFPVQIRNRYSLDSLLLGLAVTLLAGGFVILASASMSVSDRLTGEPFFYTQRQLVAAVLGLIAAGFCIAVPMRLWKGVGFLMLLLSLVLLVVVLLPGFGYTVNGSTRWVRIGFMNLQVSEPARLCFILYMASYLERKNRDVRAGFGGFLRPMALLCIVCVLLLAEPDFGAAFVLVATVLAMMFVAGARLRDFFVFSAVTVIAGSVLAVTSPYRMQRLTAFLRPWEDPYNSGFQLTQSLIAIGRGEWTGVGLGDSVQKLFYLPEAHTDFVFAVFAEEFGLVGASLLVGLFLVFVWRIFSIAGRAAATDRTFEACLCIGIGTWIGLQAFINIGVNMGLLPTKGLTLPLISYGRSSLIIMMAAIGLVLRVHHELETESAPSTRRKPRRRKAA